MQQRYYDPAIGRFLSVDPVSTNANNGGNFNRYWYANGNPLRFTDPDGRIPLPNPQFFIGIGKAFVDAGVGVATSARPPHYMGPQPLTGPVTVFGGGTNAIQQGGYRLGSAYAAAEGARATGTAAGRALSSNGAIAGSALVVRGGTGEGVGGTSVTGIARGTSENDMGPVGFSAQSANGVSFCQLCAAYPTYRNVGVTTASEVRAAGGDVVSTPSPNSANHVTVTGLTPEAAAEMLKTRANPAYQPF